MDNIYAEIHRNPRFHELERKRGRLSWALATIVVANAVWYILATAFYPEAGFARFWGTPVAAGDAITWGIVIGLAQLVLFIALVNYYVYRANGEFDALKDAIIADARRAAGGEP